MTGVPLELPLRANEAAALAGVILEMEERQPLSAEFRNRLLSRLPTLDLETIRPYIGSLVKDPTHASTYYIAIDAVSPTGAVKPLLLHMALASSPASAHFLKPILIGRMRPGAGREIVVNAIPFGPADSAAIRTFGEQIDRSFLPRPQGHLPSISIAVENPAADLPVAFAAYAAALEEFRVNLAAPIRVENQPAELESSYAAAMWAAIRAGWRDGYTIEAGFSVLGSDEASLDSMRQMIQRAQVFTKFSLDMTALIDTPAVEQFENLFDAVERSWIMEEFSREFPLSGSGIRFHAEEIQSLAVKFARLLGVAEKLYDEIRREKTRSLTGRTFDLELRLGSPAVRVEPRDLLFVMHWLKSQRRAVQFAAPYLDPSAWVEQAAPFASVIRYFNAALSVVVPEELDPMSLEHVSRSCSGKLNLRLSKPAGMADLNVLVARLRG